MPARVRIARIRSQHTERRMRWNRSEVLLLCHLADITLEELCAYIDWNMAGMRRAFKSGTFPGPVLICLELFETKLKYRELADTPKFDLPFPDKTT